MATASVSVQLDKAALSNLMHNPQGQVGQALTRLGNRMVNTAKGLANVDTGLMRSRIEFTIEPGQAGQLRIVLAARTNYSLYVHDGTKWYRGNPFLTDAARTELARI